MPIFPITSALVPCCYLAGFGEIEFAGADHERPTGCAALPTAGVGGTTAGLGVK